MTDEPVMTRAALDAADAAYRRGYQDGYEQAEADANRSWRDAASWRPGLAEVQPFVTIGGKREPVMSWRERAAADMETLRGAHSVGLHRDRPTIRCPLCGPAPVPALAVGLTPGEYSASQLHHRGHYDVPAAPGDPDYCGGDLAHPPHRVGTAPGCKACPVPAERPLTVPAPEVHPVDQWLADHPCAGGRCTDPAAHAEGAHDV